MSGFCFLSVVATGFLGGKNHSFCCSQIKVQISLLEDHCMVITRSVIQTLLYLERDYYEILSRTVYKALATVQTAMWTNGRQDLSCILSSLKKKKV